MIDEALIDFLDNDMTGICFIDDVGIGG